MTRLVLVVAAVAVLCGCSGDDSGRTALQQALAHVQANDQTRLYVEFGRPRDVPSAPAYQALRGFGFGSLAPYAVPLKQRLGVDLLHASSAISAGNPPTQSSLANGLSLSALPGAAAELGATRTTSKGATTLRFAADGRIVLTGPLPSALPGITSQLNVVRVAGSQLSYGASASAVAATTGGSPSLLSDKTIGSAASCLGDPLAAVLTERVTSAQAVASYGVQLVGVGAVSGKLPVETMCVVTDSSAHATSLAGEVRTALASGVSGVTRERWSGVFSGARVTVDGSVVKVVVTDQSGVAGRMLRGVAQGDLPGLA